MAIIRTVEQQGNSMTDILVRLQEVRNRKGETTSWLVNVQERGYNLIDRRIKNQRVAEFIYAIYKAKTIGGFTFDR